MFTSLYSIAVDCYHLGAPSSAICQALYKLELTLESWARQNKSHRIIHTRVHTEMVGGKSFPSVRAMPVIILLLVSILSLVNGHGILFDPPGRSYMSQFGFDVPSNYDAASLNCGGQQLGNIQSLTTRTPMICFICISMSPLKYQNLDFK
jgi:hypothetical protein